MRRAVVFTLIIFATIACKTRTQEERGANFDSPLPLQASAEAVGKPQVNNALVFLDFDATTNSSEVLSLLGIPGSGEPEIIRPWRESATAVS